MTMKTRQTPNKNKKYDNEDKVKNKKHIQTPNKNKQYGSENKTQK